jgi:pimeloyl-ACP methyl ester carboxylesterase
MHHLLLGLLLGSLLLGLVMPLSLPSALPSALPSRSFVNPLQLAGYPASPSGSASGEASPKPLLLYLPGFDGTLLSPFLQLPELSTTFDVRGLSLLPPDRSSFASLVSFTASYIERRSSPVHRSCPVYLAGESFGGLLAAAVSNELDRRNRPLAGLILINPATSYLNSALEKTATPLLKLPPALYAISLLRLFPLLSDPYQLPQFLDIISGASLPSVIDTPAREAYLGRCAFSLPSSLPFLSQETLDHRLTNWLAAGCAALPPAALRSIAPPTLLVVGELDRCLPSLAHSEELLGLIPDARRVVVPGAGHASTLGSRADLAALIRERFGLPGRKELKAGASEGVGKDFGMIRRIGMREDMREGMSPVSYWAKDVYEPPAKARPPVVIVPGFFNDAIDYIAPLKRDESVGLRSVLGRRGYSDVTVVPVKRVEVRRPPPLLVPLLHPPPPNPLPRPPVVEGHCGAPLRGRLAAGRDTGRTGLCVDTKKDPLRHPCCERGVGGTSSSHRA